MTGSKKSTKYIFVVLILSMIFVGSMVSIIPKHSTIYINDDSNCINKNNVDDALKSEPFINPQLGSSELIIQYKEWLKYDYCDHEYIDITNIALRGAKAYSNWLSSKNITFAQTVLYFTNYLIYYSTSQNSIVSYKTPIKKVLPLINFQLNYIDGMGVSFIAIVVLGSIKIASYYNYTDIQLYKNYLNLIIDSLLTPIDNSGSFVRLSTDMIWYTHHKVEDMVLNGHLYVLENIIRILNQTNYRSQELKNNLKLGINALKNRYLYYIRNGKQGYDLYKNVENTGYNEYMNPYHLAHIQSVAYIADYVNDKLLWEIHDQFLEVALHELEIFPDKVNDTFIWQTPHTTSFTVYNSTPFIPFNQIYDQIPPIISDKTKIRGNSLNLFLNTQTSKTEMLFNIKKSFILPNNSNFQLTGKYLSLEFKHDKLISVVFDENTNYTPIEFKIFLIVLIIITIFITKKSHNERSASFYF